MSLTRYAAAAFVAMTAHLPLPAEAQSTTAPWTFQASIYAYLPTIGGRTSFPVPPGGGNSVSVDVDTILDNLKFTFMGTFEARRGTYGMFTDVMYLNIGEDVSGTRAVSIGGVLPIGGAADAAFDQKGWVWTLGGTYNVLSTPTYSMDLIGGLRLLDIKQELTWTLTGNVGSVPVVDRSGRRDASLQNWDGVVGVKGRAVLGASGAWFMPYYFDIGTGESDLTWQGIVGLGYKFGWGDVVAAWRYLDYDMKSGKAIESLNFNGPGIAAVFRW
ncbi:MAG: hypothetical protein ING59_08725 [Burkholderiales bacterium]|jgi:hypothetical protein|nr:hypothetical protein [Burkholderiales bacterium]